MREPEQSEGQWRGKTFCLLLRRLSKVSRRKGQPFQGLGLKSLTISVRVTKTCGMWFSIGLKKRRQPA